jgi:hypothetical protein
VNKNKIVLLFLLISSLGAHCQAREDIIKKIRKDFAEINADTTLKKISLENEEFLENVPDGGGELTGFFKGDSIVKIFEWIGLSYGNRTREFYYKHDRLFFIFEKFEPFVEKNGELDRRKVKTSFEGRYYFSSEKLVEQKISGRKPPEGDSIDVSKQLQKEAKDNFQLILNKRKSVEF